MALARVDGYKQVLLTRRDDANLTLTVQLTDSMTPRRLELSGELFAHLLA